MKRNHEHHPLDDEIEAVLGKADTLKKAGMFASETVVRQRAERLKRRRNLPQQTTQEEDDGESPDPTLERGTDQEPAVNDGGQVLLGCSERSVY